MLGQREMEMRYEMYRRYYRFLARSNFGMERRLHNASEQDLLRRDIEIIVRVWVGRTISTEQIKNLAPLLLYYLKFLLEYKFQRKFDDDWKGFQGQLQNLKQFFVPKRLNYYTYFLATHIFKKYRQENNIPKEFLHASIYDFYFKHQISFLKYSQII